jgi:hypothetical protein
MRKQIQFLGHHISYDSRQADPAKVDVLQNWPSPHSRREVRTLLETFGYWRPYIRNYANITHKLTALTSEKSAFEWNADHENALSVLKLAL